MFKIKRDTVPAAFRNDFHFFAQKMKQYISESEEKKLRTKIKDNNSLYCVLFDS